MSKFKVGDRVKINKTYGDDGSVTDNHLFINKFGTIIEEMDNMSYPVKIKIDGDKIERAFREREIDLVKKPIIVLRG